MLLRDSAVAFVTAGCYRTGGHRRPDPAVGLVQMSAVRKAAPARGFDQFAEAVDELFGRHSAQAELGYSRAIYKEAVSHAVEPGRSRRLPPEAVTRDVPDGCLAAQFAEDRALADTGYAGEQGMTAGDRFLEAVHALAELRADDDRLVTERAVELLDPRPNFGLREVGLGQDDDRPQIFELAEGEQLIERDEPRRRIGQRGDGNHRFDVRRHRFRLAVDRAPFQRRAALAHGVDERLAVFQKPDLDDVTRSDHRALSRHAFERRDARRLLRIQNDPNGVLPDGYDARRSVLAHRPRLTQESVAPAPNDGVTVTWYRTLRFGVPLSSDETAHVTGALEALGVRVRFGAPAFGRQYALAEGRDDASAAELSGAFDGIVHDGALIALAIEPWTVDALSPLVAALGAPGGPAGVRSCERAENAALVEFDASVTSAAMVFSVVDAELRRYGAPVRRTTLLSPLSAESAASVAADGLQCAEMTSGRILEFLIEQSAR